MYKKFIIFREELTKEIFDDVKKISDDLFVEFKALNSSYHYNDKREEEFLERRKTILDKPPKNIKEVKDFKSIKYFYDKLNDKYKIIFNTYLSLLSTRTMNANSSYLRSYKTTECYNAIDLIFIFIKDCYLYQKLSLDLNDYLLGKQYFENKTSYDFINKEFYASVFSSSSDTVLFDRLSSIIYDNEGLIYLSYDLIGGMLLSNSEKLHDMVMDLLKSAKLSEGLRQSIVEQIDLADINVYKRFLSYINDEKLNRFSSVKRAYLTFTGLEYDISDTKFDIISKSIYNCLVLDKTNEYLLSESALDLYIGLYSLACYELNDALDYINKNYSSFENYKKATCLLFMKKSNLNIDGNYILDAISDTKNHKLLSFIISELSYKIKFNNDEDKRKYIIYISKILDDFKKIPKKYFILDENRTYSLNYSNSVKNMLIFSHEINDLYELSYKHFERLVYVYSLDKVIYKEINHPFMREKLIKLLSSNLSNMRRFAIGKLEELGIKLSVEEYQLIASYLKSKRSDQRKYICKLFKEADGNIILNCSKILLNDKNKEKQKGAIDILLENKSKINKNNEFHEIKEMIKEMKFPEEYLLNIDDLLKDNIEESNKDITEFFDNNYKVNISKFSYDKKLVKEYLNPDEKKIISFCKKVIKIHDSLIGEEYEAISYDGSKYKKKFGFEYNNSISISVHDNSSKLNDYEKYNFYDKFLDFNEFFTDKELILNDFYFSYISNYFSYLENNYSYNTERLNTINSFTEKSYYPKLKVLKTYFKTLDKSMFLNYIRTIKSVINMLIEYNNFKGIDSKKNTHDFFMNLFAYIVLKDEKLAKDDEKFINHNNEIQYLAFYKDKNKKYHLNDKEKAMSIIFTADKLRCSRICSIDESLMLYFIENKLLSIDYLYKLAFDTTVVKYGYGKSSNSQEILRVFSNLIKKNNEKGIIYDIYNKSVNKMLELELNRTESDTEFSLSLNKANIFYGSKTFLKAVFKMGKIPFVRGYSYSWRGQGKKDMFSHIVYNTKPLTSDTQEEFNDLVKKYKISDKKLLDATMYNLDYIDFTENYLKIKGLKKAAYYFKAHMNDYLDKNQETIIRRYTDINFIDLQNGQMDLAWFKSSYKELKKKNFMELYDSSKYITSGGNHKRAQYFADAVMGNIKEKYVLERINDKRNQDMILAYGLLPLGKNKLKKALTRYKRLQKFLKESKEFGAQKRASEALKVSISLNNLARNYGYNDVNRFIWKMETELISDIIEVFKPKLVEDIKVYISLENPQKPSILVFKGDKQLKSIPSKYKKNKYIIKLNSIKKELKDQYRRARVSLENAMINEDKFLLSELKELNNHPIIGSILSKLLFKYKDDIGFIENNSLLTLNNELTLKDESSLVIVHPIHLHESKTWPLWQKNIISKEIKQAFKQVFRELYLMTEDEIKNDGYTNRFAGYQVEGKRMLGIMKSRAWVINDYDGFEKINHNSNLRIDLYCYADWYTPSEIESPSIEKIEFLDNNTGKTMNMSDLSPVLFSETMRDIDLVVSVAYVGGVDVMMNHSTIEMRSRILEHNLSMFKISNYSIEKNHITINGIYGDYSIHLGSGIIQMKNKGMLPVFPVHSQHRGHIFLPFVDEDPKTSEIITKALMLAKDNTIKDPSILMYLK